MDFQSNKSETDRARHPRPGDMSLMFRNSYPS
jgi:hypothetical protein